MSIYPAGRRVRIRNFCGHLGLRKFDGSPGVVLPEGVHETAHGLQSVRLDGDEGLVITVPAVCLRLVYEGHPA
jgi:hypothetical protein